MVAIQHVVAVLAFASMPAGTVIGTAQAMEEGAKNSVESSATTETPESDNSISDAQSGDRGELLTDNAPSGRVNSEDKKLAQSADSPERNQSESPTTAASARIEGTWGEVPWTFEDGVLTLYGSGDSNAPRMLGVSAQSPWNSGSGVSFLKVEKICLEDADSVAFPAESSGLFGGLQNLVSFENISEVNTSSVVNMRLMFRDLYSLPSLDLSGWDTSHVQDMSRMFDNTRKMQSLNLSGWNTAEVTNMSEMFARTHALRTVDVSEWETSKVTDMSGMFYWMWALETLDVSGWNTKNVTDMSRMFEQNRKLQTLDVSNWDTGNVRDMSRLFNDASKIQALDVSKWNVAKVEDLSQTFEDAYGIEELDVSGWNTANVKNMHRTFNHIGYRVESLDVSKWETGSVEDMSNMFSLSNVKSLDLSGWDTSKVKNMRWMFRFNQSLESVDVSGWDVRRVTDMSEMFAYASSLKSLDLSDWNTRSVQDMSGIFYGYSFTLRTLTLGENTKLVSKDDSDDLGMTSMNCSGCTGNWVRVGEADADEAWWRGDPKSLIARSADKDLAPGTYTWHTKAPIGIDLNGGDWSNRADPNLEIYTQATVGDLVPLPSSTPVREGYRLVGWDIVSATGQKRVTKPFIVTEPALRLVAQWEAVEYVVSFDVNGGVGEFADLGAVMGESVALPELVPSRVGFVFTGWLFDGDVYDSGVSFTMPASDVTFVAQWKKIVDPDPNPGTDPNSGSKPGNPSSTDNSKTSRPDSLAVTGSDARLMLPLLLAAIASGLSVSWFNRSRRGHFRG